MIQFLLSMTGETNVFVIQNAFPQNPLIAELQLTENASTDSQLGELQRFLSQSLDRAFLLEMTNPHFSIENFENISPQNYRSVLQLVHEATLQYKDSDLQGELLVSLSGRCSVPASAFENSQEPIEFYMISEEEKAQFLKENSPVLEF